MKTVTLAEMLTDAQLDQCRAIYPDRKRIRDEVIRPNLAEINRRLGQENDLDYLSFAIVYAIDTSEEKEPIVKTTDKPRVQLSGEDGNAFAIISRCMRAAKQAGWTQQQQDKVRAELRGAGSYDGLLQTAMEHFDVC